MIRSSSWGQRNTPNTPKLVTNTSKYIGFQIVGCGGSLTCTVRYLLRARSLHSRALKKPQVKPSERLCRRSTGNESGFSCRSLFVRHHEPSRFRSALQDITGHTQPTTAPPRRGPWPTARERRGALARVRRASSHSNRFAKFRLGARVCSDRVERLARPFKSDLRPFNYRCNSLAEILSLLSYVPASLTIHMQSDCI